MTELRWLRRAVLACAVSPLGGVLAQAPQTDVVHALQPVEVLGQTPLPGLVLQRDLYPGNGQLADDAAMERAKSANLPEFMNRQLTGVTVNEVQGSPFQVD